MAVIVFFEEKKIAAFCRFLFKRNLDCFIQFTFSHSIFVKTQKTLQHKKRQIAKKNASSMIFLYFNFNTNKTTASFYFWKQEKKLLLLLLWKKKVYIKNRETLRHKNFFFFFFNVSFFNEQKYFLTFFFMFALFGGCLSLKMPTIFLPKIFNYWNNFFKFFKIKLLYLFFF